VTEGDVFFLETGTVRYCAGLLIAEIQQTSDITCLYDFDRMDVHGNKRLHVDLALTPSTI
jgi:mannose-6-phosphate isomerase class I